MPPKVAIPPISNKENQHLSIGVEDQNIARHSGLSDPSRSGMSSTAPKKASNKSKASFATFKKLLMVYCAESQNENVSPTGLNYEQRIRPIVWQVLQNIKEENLNSLIVSLQQALEKNHIQFAKTRLELQIKRYAHALNDEKFAQKFNISPVIISVRDRRGVENPTSSILTLSEEREMYQPGGFDLSILRSETAPSNTSQQITRARHSPSSKKLVIENPGVSFASFTALLNAYCTEKSDREQKIKCEVKEALKTGGEEGLGELVSRLQFAFEQNSITLVNTELALRIQKHAYYKEDEDFPKRFKISSTLSVKDKAEIDKLKTQKNIQRYFKDFLKYYCEKIDSKNNENDEVTIGEQKIVAVVRNILASTQFESVDEENFRDFVFALRTDLLRKEIDFATAEFLNTHFKQEVKKYAYQMGDQKFPQKLGIPGVLTDAEKDSIDQKKQQKKEVHRNKIKEAWQQERSEKERITKEIRDDVKVKALYQKKDEQDKVPLVASMPLHKPPHVATSVPVQKSNDNNNQKPKENSPGGRIATPINAVIEQPAQRQDSRIGTLFRARLENYVGRSIEGLGWFDRCIEWFKRAFGRNHIAAVQIALDKCQDPANDLQLYFAVQDQLHPVIVNGQKHTTTPIDPNGTLGGTLAAYLHSQNAKQSHQRVLKTEKSSISAERETPEQTLKKAGFVLKQ